MLAYGAIVRRILRCMGERRHFVATDHSKEDMDARGIRRDKKNNSQEDEEEEAKPRYDVRLKGKEVF